jgi:hypothetical protein
MRSPYFGQFQNALELRPLWVQPVEDLQGLSVGIRCAAGTASLQPCRRRPLARRVERVPLDEFAASKRRCRIRPHREGPDHHPKNSVSTISFVGAGQYSAIQQPLNVVGVNGWVRIWRAIGKAVICRPGGCRACRGIGLPGGTARRGCSDGHPVRDLHLPKSHR